MSAGVTYGIPFGLMISALMTGSYHAWLAGAVSLTVCICTSRILYALKQARGDLVDPLEQVKL